MKFFQKYFKPRSLTWWASMVPLVAGSVIATEPLHLQTAIVQSIQGFTDLPSYMLINGGLFGIGLRAAV